jgi:predicted dehydrogenase
MGELCWGLIGCGDIARKRVAPALRDAAGSRLLAVNRRRTNLAAEFAREFGAARTHADWRDLIADPEINAVYVATPVVQHAEQTIAAAEAGKHVLCEKPMALDIDSCDRMIEAARANNVRLSVAYYRRFYPVRRRIAELIAGGTLGKPVVAQINAFERYDRTADDPEPWRLNPAQSGGGPMMDFGSHRIEIFLSLLGEPRDVRGWSGNVLFDDRDVEDTAGALLTFGGGVRAQLTVSHAAAEAQDTLDVYLTEGSLHVPTLNQGELRIRDAAGERWESLPPHSNIHQPLVEDFIAAVRDGREPEVTGADGRETQRVLAQIYAS